MLQLRSQPLTPASTLAADAAMEAALAALQTAVKLDERHAESHALLGTLYGMKINGNLAAWRAVWTARGKASEEGAGVRRPGSARALSAGHVPVSHGQETGGWQEALATLLSAEKLFAAEAQRAAGPLEPRWGRSSCLTFIGRTYERLGQRAEAADYFRKALAENPADHVAKEGLARVVERK